MTYRELLLEFNARRMKNLEENKNNPGVFVATAAMNAEWAIQSILEMLAEKEEILH